MTRRAPTFRGCIDASDEIGLNAPAPTGYLAKMEWAEMQLRAGRFQRQCPHCGKWRFYHEGCCGLTGRQRRTISDRADRALKTKDGISLYDLKREAARAGRER